MNGCGCHPKWLDCLQSTGSCLLFNYSGLKSLPTDKLCEHHSLLVTKIYLKSNLLSLVPDNVCVMFGNVVELYLPSNRLHVLPPSFGELPNLENLNLDSNLLQDFPDSVFHLAKLNHLVLRNNAIQTIPSGIGEMGVLRHLDVSFNKLNNISSNIGKCKSLEKLWINRNRLTTLPRQICEIPTLIEVNISSNKITSMPIDFGKSHVFRSLCMDQNGMVCAVPHYLKHKVQRFGCSWRTQLTKDIASQFGMKLVEFDGAQGPVTSLVPRDVFTCEERQPMSLKDVAALALHRYRDDFVDLKSQLRGLPSTIGNLVVSPMGHCYCCNMPLHWTIFVDYCDVTDFGSCLMHTVSYFCSVDCAITFRELMEF